MDARRFDDLARTLGRRLPRRGLLASAGVAATAAVPGLVAAQTPEAGGVQIACESCNCYGGACGCCLEGVTGGGVVKTASGNVNFVLFATRLTAAGQQDAAGFVRWIDPNSDGGVSLESSGPISYVTDTGGDPRSRQIVGLMMVNDASQPFVLDLLDAGPGKEGQDSVGLKVGDAAAAAGATSSGFRYEAAGPLVGGDLQLLGEVAPVM